MTIEEMKDGEILKYMVKSVDGALAAGLIGMNGISMGVFNTISEFDTKAADAEFVTILRTAKKALKNLGPVLGELEEVIVAAKNGLVLARMIGDDYFMGMALEKGGNLGMARVVQREVVKEMYKRYYEK